MARFIWILPLLWLCACDGLFLETQSYSFVPPTTPQGRLCAKQCPETKIACFNACKAQQNSCAYNTQRAGQKSYLHYVNDRMAQGLLVDKKEAEFYKEARNCPDLKNCQEGCEISMRACHTNCGGEVFQGEHCLANCSGKPAGGTLGELQDWFGEKTE